MCEASGLPVLSAHTAMAEFSGAAFDRGQRPCRSAARLCKTVCQYIERGRQEVFFRCKSWGLKTARRAWKIWPMCPLNWCWTRVVKYLSILTGGLRIMRLLRQRREDVHAACIVLYAPKGRRPEPRRHSVLPAPRPGRRAGPARRRPRRHAREARGAAGAARPARHRAGRQRGADPRRGGVMRRKAWNLLADPVSRVARHATIER